MSEPWVVCVPNFSEGRNHETISEIVAAVESLGNVYVLDLHVDPDHHRSVLTFAGPADAVLDAAFRGVAVAARLIDLDRHQGVHPRVGAADVVPFVPIGSTPIQVCIDLARRLGAMLGTELELPVFLYGEAAARRERQRPADFRRGGYERLKVAVLSEPGWRPDFGPARVGPAGVTLVGARPPLIAFNMYLETPDVKVARAIAGAVRESSGGLPGVQAIGVYLPIRGLAQVSTNVLDYRQTPLHVLFDAVEREAVARGVSVLESELVGLVPTDAITPLVRERLRLPKVLSASVIEARLLEAVQQVG